MEPKAEIILAQTYESVLEKIKSVRGEDSNSVFYTSEPSLVLNMVLNKKIDIVITGQFYYHTDLTSPIKSVKFLQEARLIGLDKAAEKHFKDKDIRTGTELSELIYSINPAILTFRYSTLPEERGKIVADIPKISFHHDSIIEFLNSKELPEILKNKDWQKLINNFPDFQFYDEFMNEH